jgi:rod shape-determining protein MreD
MITQDQGFRSTFAVFGSFLVAVVLAILPLPQWAEPFRPDWVGLVLIYWCIAAPERISVGTGFWVGIVLDTLYGSILGLHALAKSLTAFIAVKTHLKMRMFPRWQQAVAVCVLLLLNQLLVLWIRGMLGKAPSTFSYWTPSIVGMVVWPWLFVILRDVRRRFRVA